MDWAELQRAVPYKEGPPLHTHAIAVERGPGWAVELHLPGRHWQETKPKGGDFAVGVTAPGRRGEPQPWNDRRFTHADLFEEFEGWRRLDIGYARTLSYALVTTIWDGSDPLRLSWLPRAPEAPRLSATVLLVASQCLALAEHRRYKTYEPLGGRYLPSRFTFGVLAGRWTASQAAERENDGLIGLNHLRSEHGREPTEDSMRLFARFICSRCGYGSPYRSVVCSMCGAPIDVGVRNA